MNLPIEIQDLIFKYLKTCVNNKNEYYLVSKQWNKIIQPNKCQKIIAFNKKICYYHHKKTIDILRKDFHYCIY